MKLIMEQWRKYLAEDMSEATAATGLDHALGQRFVVKGPATLNRRIPALPFMSVQNMFRDEDDDEDVEDDEETEEEDEDIELEEECTT